MTSLLWLSLFAAILHPSTSIKQTYIVQLKQHHNPSDFLQSLTSTTPDDILYSYTIAYNGFAASLHPHQAQDLRDSDSVLGVYEDPLYQLHTTRTLQFLGIDKNFGYSSHQQLEHAASDVIIGLLDTGVWPESKSFDDSGIPAVPVRWRGECEESQDFKASLCNKKLIGARVFHKGLSKATGAKIKIGGEEYSPRDYVGHGTHTLTTAAGAVVPNASLFGYASGTARGIAVHARVASYKVCSEIGCHGSDILAGLEKAISDGVDVLSISLGVIPSPYFIDLIAVGTFKAMQRGVFVSASAGNSGPERGSVSNGAPWIMTVGAGTIDRDFPAYVHLGDVKRITGVSLYSGHGMGDKRVELIYGHNESSRLCLPGSLSPDLVRDKVVLCDRGLNAQVEKGFLVKEAGGIGVIIANTAESAQDLRGDDHVLPGVAVGRKAGDDVKRYLKKAAKPTALLSFGGTVLGVKPSPKVATFSSRGPNIGTRQILKPDVIGPGVNILAGWSEAVAPSGLRDDPRRSRYNIISGTSMSCPHISGLVALLKAAHPKWSPSAIKSALITTAYTVDDTNSPLRSNAGNEVSTPWGHGAGHVDPQKAISPGLVYDISTREYITFVCSLGYTKEAVGAIVNQTNVNCSKRFRDPGELNYPSFAVVFWNTSRSRVVKYTRKLTNVGAAESVYNVKVEAVEGVEIIVKPERLVFKSKGERLQYTVTFVSKKDASSGDAFGSITWKNSEHQVRSPVAFIWGDGFH